MMFLDGFEHRVQQTPPPPSHCDANPAVGNDGDVSPLFNRGTGMAQHLCVYDAYSKLLNSGEYDIGGTYSDGEPELWFYFSTSFCPGSKWLLNLFVCLRKEGTYDIGVSNSNELTYTPMAANSTGRCYLPYEYKWQVLKSTQPDERFFLKSYCLSAVNLEKRTLYVPISIKSNPPSALNMDFVRQVKLNHDLGELLCKQEKTNFFVQSASGKQYPVHKTILAAHSPVLRDMVKSDSVSSLFLDISDNDMELFLQFAYTGTIKDILKQDCINLIDIASKFQLSNLFTLVQYAIADQINVRNCMELAALSERYKLDQLQAKVFQFIKDHPKVFETEGWSKLDDVHLAKKMFQFLH